MSAQGHLSRHGSAKARPVYLQQRTYLVTAGMAVECQEATYAPQQTPVYSITSSARSRNASDIVRFRAFAVLRLTANSNFSADCSGSSPGSTPFRILST